MIEEFLKLKKYIDKNYGGSACPDIERGDLLDYGIKNPDLKNWINFVLKPFARSGCPDVEINYILNQAQKEICKINNIDEELAPVYGIIALYVPVSYEYISSLFYNPPWDDSNFSSKDVQSALELLLELDKIKIVNNLYYIK